MIGHAKNDGRRGRNHLLGDDGGKINALLAASADNLRLFLETLALLFAWIPAALPGTIAEPDNSLRIQGIRRPVA